MPAHRAPLALFVATVLVLAPAGARAESPLGATLVVPERIASDEAATVTGTGCVDPTGVDTDLRVRVRIQGWDRTDAAPIVVEDVPVAADGSWSAQLPARKHDHRRKAAVTVQCLLDPAVAFTYDQATTSLRAPLTPVTVLADRGAIQLENPCFFVDDGTAEGTQLTFALYLERPNGDRDQLATRDDPYTDGTYALPAGLPAGPYDVFVDCDEPDSTIDFGPYDREAAIVWPGAPATTTTSPTTTTTPGGPAAPAPAPAVPLPAAATYTG